MDSSFNRQYSLYESMNAGQYGSTTSLNNLASRSSSRLGSPAVTSSVLGKDNQRSVKSPVIDSSMSQTGPGFGWNSGAPAGSSSTSRVVSNSQIPTGNSESLIGVNSHVSPLSAVYSGFPATHNSTSSLLGNPNTAAYGTGSSGYVGTPHYSGSQYTGQYGTGQYGSQHVTQYSPHYAYGQYGNPYGGGAQYGGTYNTNGAYANGTVDGNLSSQQPSDLDSYSGDIKGAANSDLEPGRPGNSVADPSADAGISAQNTAAANFEGSQATDEDQVIQPINIFWHYIDLQGQQQGPFSATQMNDWMAYMLDVTLVRRIEDTFFVSLESLKEVTKTSEPFVVLASSKEWRSILAKSAELMKLQAMKTESVATNSAADHETDAQDSLSQDIQQPQKKQQQQQHQQQKKQEQKKQQQQEQQQQPSYESAASKLTYAEASNYPQPVASRESSLAPGDVVTPSLANLKLSSSAATASPEAATPSYILRDAEPNSESATKSTKAASAEPVRSSSAVWKKPTVPATQVSIAELKKQQELEKKQQKKKLSESTPSSVRKVSNSRWLPLEHAESTASIATQPASPTAPSSPATATWNKQPVVPAKSLADIQKEQAMKAKSSSHSVASVVGKPVAGGSTTRIPVKQPVQQHHDRNTKVQTQQEPQHSRPSPSSTSTGATTIAKPTPRASQQQQQQANQQTPSITSAANMARPTDELVHWARVSFKDLVNGIDGMELLDVFLSLPMNGSAKEFIAESIYSYSKTLDGRRFASDFLKRRKSAEESMPAGETWKDVLRRFNPNVVEQDPSFKVVTKKRGPKIARPGDVMRA